MSEPPDATLARDEEAAEDLALEAPGAAPVGMVPWPLLLRHKFAHRVRGSGHYEAVVLAVVLFGLFTVTFSITILAVSIPTMAEELGSTESTLTWAITGPLLAFAVFGPIAGKLADIHGARRVYLIGLAGAGLFAGLTAIAWSGGSLVAFRVLGATVGAATGPASMAIINHIWPPDRRVQAMGYWSLVMAGGPVVGVVVGGPVVENLSWRLIFGVQVPLSLAALTIAYALLPETRRGDRTRFDILGAALLAVGVGSALVALNRGPELGWSHPAVIAGFVLSPVLLLVFLAVERRAEHPLLPPRYLRRRNFSFPIATQFCTNFAYMGGFIITPFFLQDVFGYGEARTGILMIARPLTFAVAGPVAGYLAVRIGERTSGVVGAVAVTASMLLFLVVEPGGGDLIIVVALALSGVGLGASSPAMAASIANAVDDRDLGIAGAAQQMVAQVGVVAGIQLMFTVQEVREAVVGAVASFHEAYLVGAVVAAAGIVTAAFVHSTERDGTREPGELPDPAEPTDPAESTNPAEPTERGTGRPGGRPVGEPVR